MQTLGAGGICVADYRRKASESDNFMGILIHSSLPEDTSSISHERLPRGLQFRGDFFQEKYEQEEFIASLHILLTLSWLKMSRQLRIAKHAGKQKVKSRVE